MTGCCAFGCSNRPEKGYLMKSFLKDPARRKLWAAMVKREGWFPNDKSVLCEEHFSPDMWERTREDGKRKLKCNAASTLFSYRKAPKERKPPTARKPLSPKKKSILTNEITSGLPLSSTKDMDFSNDNNNLHNSGSIESSSLSFSYNAEISALNDKLNEYKHKYSKVIAQNTKLKTLNKSYQYKCKIAECKLSNILKNSQERNLLKNIFNDDQIKKMEKKTTFWTNKTIKNALRLKFSCGNNGYEELLHQKYPFPSLRTLRRRLQNLKFESGISDEVLEFMKIKIGVFKTNQEKDCVLLLDEMVILPAKMFDSSTNKYVGHVTLPQHTGIATHALVMMLGGVSSRWKQTIAYYFTSDSVNGVVYEEIIFEIIKKCNEIGLNIIGIISDMASSNQSFWKHLGITAGRYSKTVNYITNPSNKDKKLFIVPDPVHVFKNIKGMLISNENIELPQSIADENNLKYKEIKFTHIKELYEHQDNLYFKLAPKLTERDLIPSHFQKMKVSAATHIISHSVSSGLKFLAESLSKPEYLTTAWFLDHVERWFTLMTSRCQITALSKQNEDIYNDSISFLKKFMTLFQSIKIGAKHIWKPCQTGVLIATKSVLDIQHILLNESGYKFILTSRFTQDSLENLFSLVRSKQPTPNALQFKTNLKLIMLSQFMKDISRGSYDSDDREAISDFLETIQKIQKPKDDDVFMLMPLYFQFKKLVLNDSEMN